MFTLVIILLAAGTMLVLALFMGYVLGWANKTFHVDVDPRVEQVIEALPGVNCGTCGFPGCSEYAEAVVAGSAPPDKCSVGGASCAQEIAKILGIELEESLAYRAVVHCGGRCDDKLQCREYRGEPTCAAADIISGVQGCTYGCLALEDCVRACKFDAIHMVDALARVDYDKCVGCGACVKACPRHIISMVPFNTEQMLVVACANKDFGKDVKAVCKVGCIGCKACQKINELFDVRENIPQIDYDKYDPANTDDLYAAIEKCPTNSLIMVGKPSEKHLATVADEQTPAQPAEEKRNKQ